MSVAKFALSVGAGVAAVVVLGAAAMTAATQVNIVDPTIPARVAHVDAGNRLAVQEVPPSTFFHALAVMPAPGCRTLAIVPAGKALIVRQVRIDVYADPTPGNGQNVRIYPNPTCSAPAVADVNPPNIGVNTVTFDPGLVIPEGSEFSAEVAGSVAGEAYVDGYTVAPSVAPLAGQVIQAQGRNGQE
jgi:hypothetical protein